MRNKATVTAFTFNGVVMYRANIWDSQGKYSSFTADTESDAWGLISGGAA